MFGGFAKLFFFAGVADEGAQHTQVGFGMVGGKGGEGFVVSDEAFAHVFDALQKGVVGVVFAFEAGEEVADGGGVGFAHQAADVLVLPFERAVGGDFFVVAHGLVQVFGQADFFQRVVREAGELHAQILQVVHAFFHSGFADPLFVVGFAHFALCGWLRQGRHFSSNICRARVKCRPMIMCHGEIMFTHSPQELFDLCALALDIAKQKGATAAEADLSESVGQDVQVRLQEIEHIEHQQDKSLDITVYLGQSKGRASTADFSRRAIEETVCAALDIARHTAQDDCAGLADAELMAREFGDLDKYHPWELSAEEAAALARRCEAAALGADARVKNSEGADVQTSHYQFAYGNSNGFLQHERGTRHSVSCSVVAEAGGTMQRDYWYDLARSREELDSMENIGRTAALRTVRRLGAASLPTRNCPVLFDATVSGSLIGHLVGALSGGALYRQSSFLTDSLGTKILPQNFSLREEPHIPRAWGSTWFDSEGVATRPRFVIENGVIQGYFLSSYSARKLGLATTGNAGGAHNLILNATCPTQAGLLRQMGSGLLVTELMGQGVNMLTGDYSRGAAGFWVENGVIQYPVEEITVAGRLQDMFADIAGVADDALRRSSHKVGSILIGSMTVAGQ